MKPEQKQRLLECIALAAQIVARRRAEAPPGFDPQNSVAAIAVVGTVAAAGATVYAANKNASAQKAAADAAAKRPQIIPAKFDDPSKAYDDYFNLASENYPRLSALTQQFNDANNAGYRHSLSEVSPSLLPGIDKQGRVADRFLHGKLTKDMQGEIQRSSAYQSLMGGYGPDSGAAHALTARDIGESSLNLIKTGSDMLGSNVSNAKAVTPFSETASNLLFTPAQLQSRSDSNAAYSAAVANGNAQVNYQNGISLAAANSYNPAAAGVISGIGALSSPTAQRTIGGAITSYQQSQQTTPAEATALASQGGGYNPYLDTNNYSETGEFIGNPYSFGGSYTGG